MQFLYYTVLRSNNFGAKYKVYVVVTVSPGFQSYTKSMHSQNNICAEKFNIPKMSKIIESFFCTSLKNVSKHILYTYKISIYQHIQAYAYYILLYHIFKQKVNINIVS